MKKLVLAVLIGCFSGGVIASDQAGSSAYLYENKNGENLLTNLTVSEREKLSQNGSENAKRFEGFSGLVKSTHYPSSQELNKQHEAEFAAEQARYEAEQARLAKLPCPRIGMTKAQGERTCWGKSNNINRTTTAAGTNEQWVFGNGRYLYFTNDRLTAIQD